MTQWPDQNPQFDDRINNPPGSALGEFTRLLLGLGLVTTVAALLLIAAAGRLSPLIPFAWEAQITRNLSFNEADPEALAALETLGRNLAAHAAMDEVIELHFHLLDSNTPNAFATLGGHVMVTRGLIREVESENGLAMVVGHEIAHIHHRDPIRQLGRGAVLSLVWALVTGGTGQTGLEQVLGTGGMLGMLRYSREMEREADALALDLLQAHYGHTNGADEFFLAMQNQLDREARVEFLQTHPLTEDRLTTIGAYGEQAGELQPLPEALARWAEKD